MIRRSASDHPRTGLATLEVVLTAGVCIPAAAAVYLLYETLVDYYFFLVGSAVGCPYL